MIDITYDMNRTECYLLLAHQVARRALVVVLCATGWQIISRDPVECRRIFAGFGQDGWTRGSFSLVDDLAAAYEASAHALVAPPAWASMHRLVVDFEVDVCRALSARADACRRAASVDTFLASIPLDGSIVNARRP